MKMNIKHNKESAYTLIELIVIIGLLFVLFGITFGSLVTYNRYQVLNKEAEKALTFLNDARTMTLSSKEASSYGVKFYSNKFVMFEGETYDANLPTNLPYEIDPVTLISNIDLSGGNNEVIFERLTGVTNNQGSIRFSLKNGQKNIEISIFQTGLAEVK